MLTAASHAAHPASHGLPLYQGERDYWKSPPQEKNKLKGTTDNHGKGPFV